MNFLKSTVKNLLSSQGYMLNRVNSAKDYRIFPVELSMVERSLILDVIDNKLTMVSLQGLIGTALACKYVLRNSIEGDFVECGVWRGGNSIVAAEIFKLNNSDKQVWLYDTFTGMTPPTEIDRDFLGVDATTRLSSEDNNQDSRYWANSSLHSVEQNFKDRGLLNSNVHFVVGDVIETLSTISNLPKNISILRLDTDWYESTKIEIENLYPKLTTGGVFIADDYGYWSGARHAIDSYFEKNQSAPLLVPLDLNIRIGVKISQ